VWRGAGAAILLFLQIFSLACSELEKPKPEPYYAEVTPPRKQEFRWSNGKAPKSVDPALAAAPPETDLVRAVFEGLTELNPTTLEAMPAVADRWTASDDLKTWTFHLRTNAVWSNGDPVTAADFVRSWRRLGEIGDKVAHPDLVKNIVGFPFAAKRTDLAASDLLPKPGERDVIGVASQTPANPDKQISNSNTTTPGPAPAEFGVSAVDEHTLQVQLITADKDFPRLVAHPSFRPVFGDANEFAGNTIAAAIVGNGAFNVASADASGVTLERSGTYWNRDSVKLERAIFVTTENAEQALAAYKAGEIDAVSNADFEPLALKLLAPFEDFRRRTHAAINFYDINHEKPPFDDRRVREALTISIERERLTEGEMEGQTQPALSFLPFNPNSEAAIIQDKERARDLLDDAGFPGGKNFPVVRLVINRNDTQQRIARAVARMWKQHLNIETEIVARENAEVEAARIAGDFDLVRRNVVFSAADELMSILSILRPPTPPLDAAAAAGPRLSGVEAEHAGPQRSDRQSSAERSRTDSPDITMTEANAIYELWAIPLYFPTSYSLVKPYVTGFDMNSLDAPLLQNVSIDNDWQPKQRKNES
jgi:oligopeptide transport system substrate-binding protein